jgi:predicted RNA-binding Zn-ribbon protein involved in translation (DUF1610 family)
MRKLLTCPKCGHQFVQNLPDVTAAEAEDLKAADDDRGVTFHCPICRQKTWLRRWDLPDLPEPP